MFTSIAEKMTAQLEMNNAIKSEDRAIYQYGIQQGLSILMNLFTTFLIGVVTGMFWESIIFSAAYMLLRRYAGGFHAKTPVRCYIYSATMVIAVLLAIKLLPLMKIVCPFLFVVGSLAIVLFAPVEDKHKPLDKAEQHVYRKNTLLIIGTETLIFVISMCLEIKMIYSTVTFAIFSIAILVVTGILKNLLISK